MVCKGDRRPVRWEHCCCLLQRRWVRASVLTCRRECYSSPRVQSFCHLPSGAAPPRFQGAFLRGVPTDLAHDTPRSPSSQCGRSAPTQVTTDLTMPNRYVFKIHTVGIQTLDSPQEPAFSPSTNLKGTKPTHFY